MAERKHPYILWILLFSAVGLLAGCQQAPQEVREQMERYQKNEHTVEAELNYCTVKELNQASVDDLPTVPENLILPRTVDFSNIEDIGNLRLAFVEDFQKNKEALAEFFQVHPTEWQESKGELEGDDAVIYDNAEDKEYFWVMDNGTFAWSSGEAYEKEAMSEAELEELYENTTRLFRGAGDDMELSFILGDEEVWLKDQIRWAEEQLNQNDIFDDTFTYYVGTVYIRHFGENKNRLSLLAQIQYHGVALDYFGGGIVEKGGIYRVGRMDNFVGMDMNRPNTILCCNNNGQFQVREYEKENKILDFPSAVSLVSKELSGFKAVTVREINVIYTLEPIYDYESGKEYYAKAGNEVRTRPVYSFMIEYGKDLSNYWVGDANAVCYVNVDMLTGEVTSNLEAKHYVN